MAKTKPKPKAKPVPRAANVKKRQAPPGAAPVGAKAQAKAKPEPKSKAAGKSAAPNAGTSARAIASRPAAPSAEAKRPAAGASTAAPRSPAAAARGGVVKGAGGDKGRAGAPTAAPRSPAAAARGGVAKGAGEDKGRARASAVGKAPSAPALSAPRKGTKPPSPVPSIAPPMISAPPRRADGWMGPLPDKPLPRNTKLPSEAPLLNRRDMEQVLTVGTRGVSGEGSLKGRLVVYQGFPYLEVVGRDKRELWFMLQGPEQEVFPAYVDHRVSVSGLIRRNHNYGGSVDVRRYSAKKLADAVAPPEPEIVDANRIRLLAPGEIDTLSAPGMSVGLRGFASQLRGRLEQHGDELYVVLSHAGTRQQVGFTLEGAGAKAAKRWVGEIVVVTGVVEKSTAWGGRIQVEICEPRAPDYPPVARESITVTSVDASGPTGAATALLNHGLSVRLAEKAGHVWAVEPQTAKRLSLREVNVLGGGAPGAIREFFFTPRNPGPHEAEFFLGKVHNPMQVACTYKLHVDVRMPAVEGPSEAAPGAPERREG